MNFIKNEKVSEFLFFQGLRNEICRFMHKKSLRLSWNQVPCHYFPFFDHRWDPQRGGTKFPCSQFFYPMFPLYLTLCSHVPIFKWEQWLKFPVDFTPQFPCSQCSPTPPLRVSQVSKVQNVMAICQYLKKGKIGKSQANFWKFRSTHQLSCDYFSFGGGGSCKKMLVYERKCNIKQN